MIKLNSKNLLKALEYAIRVIENYQMDIQGLKKYLDEGNNIEGFCQGSVYGEAISDIKKLAGLEKKDYKCSMGECPFCLALEGTNHSSSCPFFTGFDNDEDLREIIEGWERDKCYWGEDKI